MKALFTKFGGVIFFYLAIVGMIVAINNRLGSLNSNYEEPETIAYVINK